jgi:hypothetical protein
MATPWRAATSAMAAASRSGCSLVVRWPPGKVRISALGTRSLVAGICRCSYGFLVAAADVEGDGVVQVMADGGEVPALGMATVFGGNTNREMTSVAMRPVFGTVATMGRTKQPGRSHRGAEEAAVRIGAAILVVWLIIGLIAAAQRGYFNSSSDSCAKAGSTIVTIIAGPLNYVGVNPKIVCHVPQPSK